MTCCAKWFRVALWSVVAATASLASSGTATASEKGVLSVKDNGSVFTADGIRKAELAFEAVTFQATTKFAVVTYGKVPEGKRSAFEAAKGPEDKKRFFREWAEEVAGSGGKPDVLVFVSMEGSHIRAIDDRQTDLKRNFDDRDLRALEQKFVAGFKPGADATDTSAKLARHDAALLESVNFVADQLKNTTLPANGKRNNGAVNDRAETKGTSIMSYVCIGIVAILGIWLVIGLVRMMTGGGGGGGGYGGGGMGGGGMMGGGGGGFMSGLMGGMLGAVAGNYLYNSFTGGNHSTDSMGSSGGGYGDSGTTGDTGAGDYSGGGDGGGSDFGGDSGGGDSGGGDFGGGDSGGSDFGGGGDSGGGDW